MILDDNSREISIRKVELVSLKEKTIVFHIKHSDIKQYKSYETLEAAKEDFDKISKRVESYFVVKSGGPFREI